MIFRFGFLFPRRQLAFPPFNILSVLGRRDLSIPSYTEDSTFIFLFSSSFGNSIPRTSASILLFDFNCVDSLKLPNPRPNPFGRTTTSTGREIPFFILTSSLSITPTSVSDFTLTSSAPPTGRRLLAPSPPDPSYPIFWSSFIPIPFVCFSHLPRFGSFDFGGTCCPTEPKPRPMPPPIIALIS